MVRLLEASYFHLLVALSSGLESSLKFSFPALILCRVQVARQLSLRIGFPWTVRVMGFLILFNTMTCLTFARPRLHGRPRGSLVDISAFLDPVYSLFAVGIFLAVWGLYFAYYYVCQLHPPFAHRSAP